MQDLELGGKIVELTENRGIATTEVPKQLQHIVDALVCENGRIEEE